MSRIIQLDSTFTDNTLPTMKWLADYEAKIKALAGIAGWWDVAAAYRTIGTGVSQLTDRSGNGKHLVQATAGKQPPVSAGAAGILIPRDALAFDGATDRNMGCANFFDGSSTWSYVSYSKPMAAGVQSPISTSALGAYFSSPAVTGYNNSGSVSPTGGILNKQCLLIDIVTTTDQYLECLDKSSTIAASYPAPANATTLYIGEFVGSSSYKMNGLWFEAIVFKSDLRAIAGALALIREYFAYKYER